MSIAARTDALIDDLSGQFDGVFLVAREDILLLHKPGKNLLVQVAIQLFVHHAHAAESAESVVLQANQVLLADDASNVLLVGGLALLLPRPLLVSTTFLLRLDTSLSSLESLGLDELGVADLLVLFLLVLHDGELGLLEDFHARLLKSLRAENVEHRLNLDVEVEQLPVIIEDLRLLAVLLGRHLGLEKRHRGSVEIELRGDADLLGRRLIRQILDVLVGLEASVDATWDGLWRRNVAVGVDGDDALRSLYKFGLLGRIGV